MTQQTILEGSTFCICDERGDVREKTHGLFADDTRFLSRLELTIDGKPPLLLSSGNVEYFSAAYFLRNPLTNRLPLDSVLIKRERFVGNGMQDHIDLTNETTEPLELRLELHVAADFADIISVKEWDFSLGDPVHARPLPSAVAVEYDERTNQLHLVDPDGYGRTQVIFSVRGDVTDEGLAYDLTLAPRETWSVRIDVGLGTDGALGREPDVVERHFGEERARVAESVDAWQLRVPQIRATWNGLQQTFGQSVNDLAALRMRTADDAGGGKLPAAGMPWFMTVFGRDTLITCLQTMLFGPELARSALRELARLQSTEDDPSRDAEPGKIVHEMRRGKCATKWFDRYYGTADATPLFLVLLSEAWRWTDDSDLVHELKEPALAALRWIDEYGDHDGDGFVEYARRTERGLENQSWKDSGDSQRFHDGRFAQAPIAPCEVQGYVYDAKRRMAELAREVWREPELADRLERDAAQLARPIRRGLLGRGARRLLRARARRGEEPRRLALLEHRPSALERHRSAGARRRGRRRADGRRPVVGLGCANDVARRDGVQPAQLPQRHGLATRQFADRVGAREECALARGAPHRALDARRREHVRATSCPRSSPACRAPSLRSRSRIRLPRALRRGLPAHRCCCSSSCSASSPIGGGM